MRNFLVLCIAIIAVLSFGCGNNNADKHEPPKQTSQQASQDANKSNDDFLKKNDELIKEMAPHRKEMKDTMINALKGYDVKVNDPALSKRDVFSLDCELNTSSSSEENAKTISVEVINKLRNTKFPYSVDSYTVVVMNKQSPVAMISYSPDFDKFYIAKNGQHKEFTP